MLASLTDCFNAQPFPGSMESATADREITAGLSLKVISEISSLPLKCCHLIQYTSLFYMLVKICIAGGQCGGSASLVTSPEFIA